MLFRSKRMIRTSKRALPAGKLSSETVFLAAVSCTLAASMLLVSGVNYLAAGLTLLGLFSYVILYTVILNLVQQKTLFSEELLVRYHH